MRATDFATKACTRTFLHLNLGHDVCVRRRYNVKECLYYYNSLFARSPHHPVGAFTRDGKIFAHLAGYRTKDAAEWFFFQIIFCFSPTTLYTSTHDRCAAISRYIVLHGGHYLQTDAIEETATCRVPPLSPHQRSCHLSYASSRAPCDHSRPTAIIFQFFVSHSAK